MAKQIVIWIVDKPFDFDGEHYEPGDQWAQPPGWTVDEHESQMHDYPIFHYQLDQGSFEKLQGAERRPVLFDKNMVLPVVRSQEAPGQAAEVETENIPNEEDFVFDEADSDEIGLSEDIVELLNAEGLSTPFVIETAPDEALLEIPGIGPGKLKKIREVYPHRDA